MNRNYVGITLGAISLVLFFVASAFMTPQAKFNDICVTNEKYEDIISKREETDEPLLTNLKFNDHKVYYSNVNRTWYYSVVEEEENAYDPSINTNDKISLAFYNEAKIDKTVIASGKPIDIIAYNDKNYARYHLAITTLPIITIDHEQEMEDRDDVEMTFELFDNRKNTTKRITKTAGKIHTRGNVSLQYPKKSYRLNLRYKSPGEHDRNANESLLGMRADDDWILSSPYMDSEKIRNHLNEALWYEASADNGAQTGVEAKYVEVIENGKYAGLYSFSTTIDEKSLGFTKNSNGNYEEYLYKKEIRQSYRVDDSYDLKTDNIQDEEKAWKLLADYSEKGIIAKDINYIKSNTNIESVIDTSILDIFTLNTDMFGLESNEDFKNVYIAFKNTEQGKKAFFIPWDLDSTWGREWHTKDATYDVDASIINDQSKFIIDTLKQDPEYAKQIKNRYIKLRQTHWSNEHINELINNYEKQIFNSGAYIREKVAWPTGSYIPADKPQNLSRFKEYVKKHIEYVDYYYGLINEKPEPLGWQTELKSEQEKGA